MFERSKRTILAVIGMMFVATLSVIVATPSPASAAVGCQGGVDPASLLVTRDQYGNPTGRYAYGFAWNQCEANEPITQEVCVKFEIWGGAWYPYTTFRCNPDGGLYTSVTRTNSCSDVGNALIRTVGRATVRGIRSGLSQTRTYYEVGTRPCA